MCSFGVVDAAGAAQKARLVSQGIVLALI